MTLATQDFIIPHERTTGQGCIAQGEIISYECTVDGGAITVWRGSAFNYCSAVSIALLHSLFTQPDGVSGECGDLTAMSVRVSGTEYTSRLTLTATDELNGKKVNCTPNGVDLIGSDTIRIGGRSLFSAL